MLVLYQDRSEISHKVTASTFSGCKKTTEIVAKCTFKKTKMHAACGQVKLDQMPQISWDRLIELGNQPLHNIPKATNASLTVKFQH